MHGLSSRYGTGPCNRQNERYQPRMACMTPHFNFDFHLCSVLHACPCVPLLGRKVSCCPQPLHRGHKRLVARAWYWPVKPTSHMRQPSGRHRWRHTASRFVDLFLLRTLILRRLRSTLLRSPIPIKFRQPWIYLQLGMPNPRCDGVMTALTRCPPRPSLPVHQHLQRHMRVRHAS